MKEMNHKENAVDTWIKKQTKTEIEAQI